VLAYIIKSNPQISITSLMKLSYLSDLVSTKVREKRITNFEYVRFLYGPFDKKIYKYIERLETDHVILEGANISSTGDEFVTFSIDKKADLCFDKISDEEREIIGEVLESLEGFGPKALTELTYRTKPMRKLKATLANRAGLNKTLDLNA